MEPSSSECKSTERRSSTIDLAAKRAKHEAVMALRDSFAAQALAAIIIDGQIAEYAANSGLNRHEEAAIDAYDYADAMMKARGK